MKTYKYFLEASNHFLNNPFYSKLEFEQKEYYHLASVIISWFCLESFVNTISDSLSHGTRLKPHEKAYLNEKELIVNEYGAFQKIKSRPSTPKKILFILHHFSKIDTKEFKSKNIWRDLKAFEDLRNKIIHHKEKNTFNISLQKAIECRDLVNEIIKFINKEVFKK